MNGITHLFMPELDELTEDELVCLRVRVDLETQMDFERVGSGLGVRKDCFKEL